MPHITFKNIKEENVKKLGSKLVNPLVELIGCPINALTFNYTSNKTFAPINDEGEIEESRTIVFAHIKWFKKTEEIQNKVAKLIEDEMKKELKIEGVEVVINFEAMEIGSYYKKGVRR